MAPLSSSLLHFTHLLLLLATAANFSASHVNANPLPEVDPSAVAEPPAPPEDYEAIFEASYLPPSATPTDSPISITAPESTPTDTSLENTTVSARGITKRSFVYTCFPPFSISGSIFSSGKCQKANGQYMASSVDLNKCVANANGFLGWMNNGRFGLTCPWTDIVVDWLDDGAIGNVRLKANCRTISGTYRYSELALGTLISLHLSSRSLMLEE